MNCIVSLALKGLHAGSRLHKVEVLKYVIVVRHYCITVVPPPLEKTKDREANNDADLCSLSIYHPFQMSFTFGAHIDYLSDSEIKRS